MNIEILAPAGSSEALRAAVFAGADALYMGGSLFSARASAVNFSDQELEKAVAFARERGVRCYVTVNTLLKDGELPEVLSFAAFLCSLPVDGILVQDMGLFRLLKKRCPKMPIHCSTQMSLHTPAGVKMMGELGATRAVLSRELSLQEIAEIHAAADIELEAFVHGALCMSVSGQCYFSAMLGSRSGNRGRCAQPCRLPFGAPGGTGNDLSLKDMSFIEEIGRLAEAGVVSAKIEGRMKRPEYVAAAVSAARKAADGEEVPPVLLENLEAVFSRSGFTKGYLTGNLGRDMFGIRTKEDVVSGSAALFGSLHELYRNERPRVPLGLEFSLFAGQKPRLCMWDDKGRRTELFGDSPAETALHKPVDEARIRTQLSKFGGTPYYAKEVRVCTDGLCALPLSVLGDLRRRGCEQIGEMRRRGEPVAMANEALPLAPHRPGPFRLRGVFRTLDQIPADISALDWAYLPLGAPEEDFSALLKKGLRVGAEIPRGLFGAEVWAKERILLLQNLGVSAFLCGNLGAVALCRELGVEMHGGFSLNVTNTQALAFFEDLGLADTELSYELTLQEIGRLGGNLPRGVMVYGRQALMLTRNCPIANSARGCLHCKAPQVLTDRKGIKFPVMCSSLPKTGGKGEENGKCAEVFNSVPLSLSDRMGEITGADFGILRFTVENAVESGQILSALIRQETLQCDHTRGLFYRGVI